MRLSLSPIGDVLETGGEDVDSVLLREVNETVDHAAAACDAVHFRELFRARDAALAETRFEAACPEEEFPQSGNDLTPCFHGLEIRGKPEDVYRKLMVKGCGFFVQAVLKEVGENDGETESVSNVVFRGDFVLNPVTHKGRAVRGPEGEAVESPGRSPHDVSPGLIIAGLLHNHGDEMKDGFHETFHDTVEDIKVGAHEVDFQIMDEGIDGAARGLERTHGKGLGGIEEGCRRIERGIAEEGLLPGFDIVDYAKAVHICSCSGYG